MQLQPSTLTRLAGLALVILAASCGPTGPEQDEQDDLSRERCALSSTVTQWRKLVEKHFKYQHVTWALNIIKCESGGNPSAYNASSGASGLFQHLKKYWPPRAAAAGFSGYSAFHAEANIAASAYLLYANGGGPQHWSCKFSPFQDFNYKPVFYKNGQPVSCKPSCSGSKITSKDCGVGDCAVFGASCVNDSLGVRCVSVFCPAQGKKKVCVSDKLLGTCNNGGITTGDCSKYGAFCSTAGNTAARCVSAFCASSPKEVTKAHGICLPDGRLAQCTAQGGLTNAKACLAPSTCVATSGAASCVAPASDSGPPTPAPDAEPAPTPDLGTLPDLGAEDSGAPAADGQLPPLTVIDADAYVLDGSCQTAPGVLAGPLPWPLLLLLGLALGRRATRRGH